MHPLSLVSGTFACLPVVACLLSESGDSTKSKIEVVQSVTGSPCCACVPLERGSLSDERRLKCLYFACFHHDLGTHNAPSGDVSRAFRTPIMATSFSPQPAQTYYCCTVFRSAPRCPGWRFSRCGACDVSLVHDSAFDVVARATYDLRVHSNGEGLFLHLQQASPLCVSRIYCVSTALAVLSTVSQVPVS